MVARAAESRVYGVDESVLLYVVGNDHGAMLPAIGLLETCF